MRHTALMEPAMDVIHRTLQGDAGARSFLERTASIYVLDVTDPSKPKTYGCWNFIHQAMNEIERYENQILRTNNGQHPTNGASLAAHVRLLATMALRVARRSPASDRAIVGTCISNAAEYHGSASQSQWLMDLNLELREIVMGRIAAMAFDFSFHRRLGPHGHSAFADPVVMDTFCAILSANAVSNGPAAIRHFATEWIIPSSRNLPVIALVSVVLHLAIESRSTSAPAGTKDMLQQLSVPIMSVVIVPALANVLSEDSDESAQLQQSNVVATVALRAMQEWCQTTDLSLPQTKHICSKVEVNVVDVLNDVMYSDSPAVIDALAGLFETTMKLSNENVISEGRMNQVRHIINVDEKSFQANFSPEQLKTIESKEMAAIIGDMVSAVGLQRLRFRDRQAKGDDDVCRNLSRIAACASEAWLFTSPQDPSIQIESGMIELLLLAAAHPAMSTASIALQVLPRFVSAANTLAVRLLPLLQRRAIIPHSTTSGVFSLSDSLGFHEFQNFRNVLLADALTACWKANGDGYMDSCTSAVEEFCSDQSSVAVSFHLEAALFCIEAVGARAMESLETFHQSLQLTRCTHSLSKKSPSLTSNPVTTARMCRMLQRFARWYKREGGLDMAAELAAAAFMLSVAQLEDPSIQTLVRESSASPLSLSAQAMDELVSVEPENFVTDSAVKSLLGLWLSSCTEARSKPIPPDARISLGGPLCRVAACLEEEGQEHLVRSLICPVLECLAGLCRSMEEFRDEDDRTQRLQCMANEIHVLAAIFEKLSLTETEDTSMTNDDTVTDDKRIRAQGMAIALVREQWSLLTNIATNWSYDEIVLRALFKLFSRLVPALDDNAQSVALIRDIGTVASSMVAAEKGGAALFRAACDFMTAFVKLHGHSIDRALLLLSEGSVDFNAASEVGKVAEKLTLDAIEFARPHLGNALATPAEQRQGQGQPAFESRAPPQPVHTKASSDDCAGPLLSLLTQYVKSCPLFLVYLPAGPSRDREQDQLIRRAVASAVSGLGASDGELIILSIQFLEELEKQSSAANEKFRKTIVGELNRVCADVTSGLLLGCCNKFGLTFVRSSANLLYSTIRSLPWDEMERILVDSLRQDDFLLGDAAKNVTLAMLGRCANGSATAADLQVFLEQVHTIHQSEDSVAIPGSDAVASLIQKYGA